MNYDETLDFLFNRLQSFHNDGAKAYKPGLERAYRLSEAFGNPHTAFPSIHIGGTNGKGSTAHSIASVLMEAGLKVGLYTSPHLVDFSERIRIDGQPIPEEAVTDFVSRYLDLGDSGLDPSFFELTTIMAFDHFARNNIDIAVIEVGLGGRLDTTNIITPLLSVITNISYDHVALLGNTLTEIATEKAGIIKRGVPAVIGRRHPDTDAVFAEKGDNVVFAADRPLFHRSELTGNTIKYYDTPWGDVESYLTGSCQPENMQTILTALTVLDRNGVARFTPDTVRCGLKNVCANTSLMGRWMKISDSPTVIADTGHNVDAWQFIAPRLAQYDPDKLFIVIGFVNDKDFSTILSLLPKNAHYFFVQPSVNRAACAEAVATQAEKNGLSGNVYPTVGEGYKAALKSATRNSVIYVGGSTFVVADLLKFIHNS